MYASFCRISRSSAAVNSFDDRHTFDHSSIREVKNMSKGNEQGGGGSGPGGGGSGKGREKIMVSVNSIDGNIKRHPFDATDTVGDVHGFSYDKLVQQKDQITLDRTWIEF